MTGDLEVIQVIRTRLAVHGRGTGPDDVLRRVEQYWGMDGELLFEFDTYTGQSYSPEAQRIQRVYVENLPRIMEATVDAPF